MLLELKSEYQRDMHHNYLVIQNDKGCSGTYYENIQKYNNLNGVLSYEERQVNHNRYAYYKVDGLQAASCVYEKRFVGKEELIKIVTCIIKHINQGRMYLLKETDYILSEEYLFIEMPVCEVFLCYYPGYGVALRQQLKGLFEFFMNRVDYNDQAAVYLIYRLYSKVREEDCTMQSLKVILSEPVKGSALHQMKTNNFVEKLRRDSMVHSLAGVGIKDKKEFEFPFIEQRVEQEREVLYYPVKNYLVSAATIIMAMVSMYVIYQCRVFLNKIGRFMGSRIMLIIGVAIVMIATYIVYRLFRTSEKQSKMIPEITYVKPERENMLGLIEETGMGKPVNDKELDGSDVEMDKFKGLAAVRAPESIADDQERTVVLSEYLKKQRIHPELLPYDVENYASMILCEFPFFIGKLKSRMDYGIDCSTVSRFHAKITKENEEYYIYDLNSTNGTFVNGRQLKTSEKTIIKTGDEIRFAEVAFKFIVHQTSET